jgi:hypothetical protein
LQNYHPHLPWERGTGGGEAEKLGEQKDVRQKCEAKTLEQMVGGKKLRTITIIYSI